MVQKFCQSCGMPLNNSNKGTNADGNPNEDYCIYCYKEGKFTQDFNMSQMIEFCTQFKQGSGLEFDTPTSKGADAAILSNAQTLEAEG